MNRLLLIPFSIGVLISACSTTTAKTKDPVLNAPIDTVGIALHNLVKAKHINLDGETVTKDGKTTSDLKIEFTDGLGIPGDDTEMKKLGREIAIVGKKYLQDPKEYDEIIVYFITIKKSENALIEKTERSWRFVTFKASEL